MKQVTSSPPSKDVVSAPTFEDVARFVVGPDAPAWLVAHFKRWAKSLVVDRFVEEKQPTKVAMKRQLADVKDAALLLRRALSDTPTREFLEIASQGPIEHHGVLDHLLADLAERAERASASSMLSTDTGKTKAGRKRAAPADASAKLFCAALIAEAWKYFHDTDPPPRNQDAARAADAYWRASGGETNNWTVPLNGWRPYFQQVQEPSLAAVRAECRRHLIEVAHRG